MKRVLHTAVVFGGLAWLLVRVPALRASLAVFADSMAHASQWIGVTDPGLAWLLLGVVAGGIVGAFVGMRRAGRAVSRGQVRGTAVVVGGALLVAGSYPPSGIARAADRPTHLRPLAAGVHVATGRVTMHAAPDAGSDVTAVVAARTRLTVLQTSGDGDWSYVETLDRSPLHGWVRRASLSDGVVATPRPRLADTPERVAPIAPASPAYTTGGEVQLDPAAAPAAAAPSRTPDAGTPDRGASASNVDSAPPAAESVDRSVVVDVQARLAQARGGASTGDYPAALRALTAADEGVTLAAGRYGEAAWIASLRRDAASARASVRAGCQGAAAAATRRGDPPPRCE